MRTFHDTPAVRTAVPLMVGLVGPSGGGKSNSAFRLATGIQRVTGGEIFMIDTESNRGLHFAPKPGDKADPAIGTYNFRHVPFGAPFGSLDYLAAIEHCVRRGAKIVIVDSMSPEHEGQGGVLETHEDELQRMGGHESKSMLAWGKPKRERRQMINAILQLPISSIFCFRARDKIKITPRARLAPGEDAIKPMGWMPIAGEEFIYEMTVNCLLLPRAGGVPTWDSKEIGERATMKLPRQFEHIFAARAPLSEDIGESLARWADGAVSRYGELIAEIDRATAATLEAIIPKVKAAQKTMAVNDAEFSALKSAFMTKKKALAAPPPSDPGTSDEERARAIDAGAGERQPGEDG